MSFNDTEYVLSTVFNDTFVGNTTNLSRLLSEGLVIVHNTSSTNIAPTTTGTTMYTTMNTDMNTATSTAVNTAVNTAISTVTSTAIKMSQLGYNTATSFGDQNFTSPLFGSGTTSSTEKHLTNPPDFSLNQNNLTHFFTASTSAAKESFKSTSFQSHVTRIWTDPRTTRLAKHLWYSPTVTSSTLTSSALTMTSSTLTLSADTPNMFNSQLSEGFNVISALVNSPSLNTEDFRHEYLLGGIIIVTLIFLLMVLIVAASCTVAGHRRLDSYLSIRASSMVEGLYVGGTACGGGVIPISGRRTITSTDL